jgi:hypothetical protein
MVKRIISLIIISIIITLLILAALRIDEVYSHALVFSLVPFQIIFALQKIIELVKLFRNPKDIILDGYISAAQDIYIDIILLSCLKKDVNLDKKELKILLNKITTFNHSVLVDRLEELTRSKAIIPNAIAKNN